MTISKALALGIIVLIPRLLTGIAISLQLLLFYVTCGFISLMSSFDI